MGNRNIYSSSPRPCGVIPKGNKGFSPGISSPAKNATVVLKQTMAFSISVGCEIIKRSRTVEKALMHNIMLAFLGYLLYTYCSIMEMVEFV